MDYWRDWRPISELRSAQPGQLDQRLRDQRLGLVQGRLLGCQPRGLGLGIYSVFTNPNIFLTRAIEAPNNTNVRFHSMITVCIGANGGISNVINNTGGATGANVSFTPKVTNFP